MADENRDEAEGVESPAAEVAPPAPPAEVVPPAPQTETKPPAAAEEVEPPEPTAKKTKRNGAGKRKAADEDDSDEEGDTVGLRILKESVGSFIAIALVLVAVWLLVYTFRGAGDELSITQQDIAHPEVLNKRIQQHNAAQANRKDILTVAVSLLGVILGFYFGRVPAERRAERAERTAGKAQSSEKKAVAGQADAARQAADATHTRDHAEGKVNDARRTVERLKRNLAPIADQQRKTLSAAGQPFAVSEFQQTVDELEALERRLA